ncbi:hypothetical protein SAMN05878482_102349 [Peribacillus simplex]|uniref:Uncharacterized protein n=1 Tax=Peribacillus simplex TaxID=1478 RepID=A0A9X8R7H4_9BACI|nr:hypothetical protein SAMN05878482_102349 [Peribacillus simplex]
MVRLYHITIDLNHLATFLELDKVPNDCVM